MSAHIVRPGEHLRAICFRRGLNADKVWRSPDNEELRKTREDPAILCPGDILHLPAAEPKFLPVKIGAVNTYVTCVPTIPVKIVVQGTISRSRASPTRSRDWATGRRVPRTLTGTSLQTCP